MKTIMNVGKPYLINEDDSVKLEVELKWDEKSYKVWYKVDKKYGEFFSYEVSDYILCFILLYCMEHNYDLYFEGKLSEEFYNNITEYLMPAISQNIKQYNSIKITHNGLVNYHFNGNHVGTGLSCGVDSFYTIFKNISHSKESNLSINTLTFFNAGASGEFGGDLARQIYLERGHHFSHVAKELNCDFLMVDTNANEFLMQNHEATHVFRTLSIPLALQKYFSRYYFSSTYQYSDFKFDWFDPSLYDLLNMACLSTSNIKFVLVGGETTRMGKVEYISQFPLVQRELNVCIHGITNDNTCSKCKRTILNLYLLGKIDLFDKCFDVPSFYKNKRKMIRWCLASNEKVDIPELKKWLKKKKEIKISDRVYVFFFRPCRFIYKTIRKTCRIFLKKK